MVPGFLLWLFRWLKMVTPQKIHRRMFVSRCLLVGGGSGIDLERYCRGIPSLKLIAKATEIISLLSPNRINHGLTTFQFFTWASCSVFREGI